MREQLQSISLGVRNVNAAQEAEMAKREEFISILQQFTTTFRKRTADFIQFAAELHNRSDARLGSISESTATKFGNRSLLEARSSELANATSSLEKCMNDECQNMTHRES